MGGGSWLGVVPYLQEYTDMSWVTVFCWIQACWIRHMEPSCRNIYARVTSSQGDVTEGRGGIHHWGSRHVVLDLGDDNPGCKI